MNQLIAPSILSADFGELKKDIEMINRSQADWIHVDVMDGVFVPNISFGFPVIKYVKKFADKPLDVHLMIVKPERYIEEFKKVGADILTVHYETCDHLHKTIYDIKNLGMKAGVTLNPHTPVSVLDEIIVDVDMVLIMSVNPGFGGQKFITNSLDKVKRLKELIVKKQSNSLIEIDGGVSLDNAKSICDAGVDILVAGNTIFASENPEETISKLKKL